MTVPAKRLLMAALIAAGAASAANLAAALIIKNIALIIKPIDSSEILYSRLIQLKDASVAPSWLFPVIFGVIIGIAAVTENTGKMKAAAIAITVLSAFGALITALWDMSVNSVPFGSFLTILFRYIKGGLLDAL